VIEESNNVASYSYDSSLKELISYDTPNIVKIKTQYINSNGMAGSMFWSLDSDKLGVDSLVGTSVGVLGGLDQTQNHLSYPDSKWTNIANLMQTTPSSPPSSSSVSSTTSSPPPSSSSVSSTTSSPPPSSSPVSSTTAPPVSSPVGGLCAGVAPWSSSVAYVAGQTVTYNAHLWSAPWWTQGDIPGGSSGVWLDKGAC